MIKWLVYLVGLEYNFIQANRRLLNVFCSLIILALCLTFFGFWYAISNTTQNIFLSLVVSIFFGIFLINIYRLVFSISEGELNKYDSFSNVILFVLKRGILIIALAIFISKSLEVYVFKSALEPYFVDYKKEFKQDFNRTLELINNQERNFIEEEYNIKIYDDKLFDRYSKSQEELYQEEKALSLDNIEKRIENKNQIIDAKIQESNFFVSKIRLISIKLPATWLFTLLVVSIFLSPILFYLLSPVFESYDDKTSQVNSQIITEEYATFKRVYQRIMYESTGKKIEFVENFIDPPFNQIRIKSDIKNLTNGTLVKWIKLQE